MQESGFHKFPCLLTHQQSTIITATTTPAKETQEFKAKKNLSLSTLSNRE
jgi:hypothetical protein